MLGLKTVIHKKINNKLKEIKKNSRDLFVK